MACLDDQDALNAVFDLIDDSADVAALTYQFFTGAIPTALYVEPLEIASHLYPAYLPEVSTEDLLLERIGADGITLSGLGNDCIDFDRSRGAYAAGFFSGQPYEPVAAFIPESGYDQPYRPTRKYRRYGRWSNKTKQGKRRRR
ncbi:MAG TPA: hypothetical protein VHO23_01160 [Candidatus Paceibacterota bacterium]|nr:hypothetical protein [Candidatus Paceibacterota bacterium]